ncbi:kelch repeat-containing protein [Cardiosporidium cionae]|uniref:Kelch repeat-containing protein n=1 Tax=Cardiosporidium cionae TaxID=476202 RepID=A0ABQ7J801_9APIC|nr:kelch repeat-containing protein [Cardiosporidium cionae]|eukprot:KAF8820064.1 kelch repeat-containing protein [Cardiosporidium cionae]
MQFVVSFPHYSNFYSSVEKFNTRTMQWTAMPNMHLNRNFAASCSISGDRIVVCGGSNEVSVLNSVEMFDPVQNTWCTLPPMLEKRHSCAAVGLGCHIYVIGGRDEPGNHGRLYKEGEKLELSKHDISVETSWTAIAPLQQGRLGFSAAVFQGCLWAIGGSNGVKALKSAEIYNPSTNQWTKGPSLNQARISGILNVWQGQLIIFGGYEHSSLNTVTSIEKLESKSFTWKIIGNSPLVECCMSTGITINATTQVLTRTVEPFVSSQQLLFDAPVDPTKNMFKPNKALQSYYSMDRNATFVPLDTENNTSIPKDKLCHLKPYSKVSRDNECKENNFNQSSPTYSSRSMLPLERLIPFLPKHKELPQETSWVPAPKFVEDMQATFEQTGVAKLPNQVRRIRSFFENKRVSTRKNENCSDQYD